ncbi:MAG: PaaI family thioesterase [Dehalococcoidia bacterium]
MPEFDDAWYEEWIRQMVEGGGNVIAALGLRPVEASAERVVMEMPMGPNVRQGTGVFAAGPLMQLADVGATMIIQRASGSTPENPAPFPLSVQISVNLLRNTNTGKAISESRIVHRGRTLTVVESRVHDEAGRLLCIVTSTHVAPGTVNPA